MVIWVKIFKTEKTIEIHLVRLTESCGKVLSEKYAYKSVKKAFYCPMLLMRTTKQLFVYKQRSFSSTFSLGKLAYPRVNDDQKIDVDNILYNGLYLLIML